MIKGRTYAHVTTTTTVAENTGASQQAAHESKLSNMCAQGNVDRGRSCGALVWYLAFNRSLLCGIS